MYIVHTTVLKLQYKCKTCRNPNKRAWYRPTENVIILDELALSQ